MACRVRETIVGLALLLLTASPGISQTLIQGGLALNGPPAIPTSPAASPFSTLSLLDVRSTAASDTLNEFIINCGLDSSVGGAITSVTQGNKVCIYAGTVGRQGSGNIWSINTVTQAATGFFGKTHISQGIEVDVLNNDRDVFTTEQPIGLLAPYSTGISISGMLADGKNYFRNTVAYNTGGGSWQFGYTAFGDVSQAPFYEMTSAAVGMDLVGGHATAGLRVGHSPVSLDLTHGLDQRVLMRGHQNLSMGSALTSTNAAGSAFEPLEIQSSGFLLSGGAVRVGHSTPEGPGGEGAFNAGSYLVGGVAGATCTGQPTKDFSVVNGLVVKC